MTDALRQVSAILCGLLLAAAIGCGDSGGSPADAGIDGAGDNHGSGGAGGMTVDAPGANGGSDGNNGSGGVQTDAAPPPDAGADAVSQCASASNAKACVTCCDTRFPRGMQQAFFGDECLYCTGVCGNTRICTGPANGGAPADIDGPCLACAQMHLTPSCPAGSGAAECASYFACLKDCPTN